MSHCSVALSSDWECSRVFHDTGVYPNNYCDSMWIRIYKCVPRWISSVKPPLDKPKKVNSIVPSLNVCTKNENFPKSTLRLLNNYCFNVRTMRSGVNHIFIYLNLIDGSRSSLNHFITLNAEARTVVTSVRWSLELYSLLTKNSKIKFQF